MNYSSLNKLIKSANNKKLFVDTGTKSGKLNRWPSSLRLSKCRAGGNM